jgi:hypothetical protein
MPTSFDCSEFCGLMVVKVVTDQVSEEELYWEQHGRPHKTPMFSMMCA